MDYVVKRLVETAILIAGGIFAYWIRFDTFLMPEYYLIPFSIFVISSSYLLVIENGTASRYASQREIRPIRIFSAVALSGVITATFLYFTKTGESFSRAWLIYSVFASYGALLLIRILAKLLIHLDTPVTNIIVLGNSPIDCYQASIENEFLSGTQINIVKVFSPEPDTIQTSMTPVLQFIEARRARSDKKDTVKQVWVNADLVSKIGEVQLANSFSDSSVELKYLLESPRPLKEKERFIRLQEHIVIDASPSSKENIDLGMKLLFDRVMSLIALIALAPILLLIALAIKLTSKGPIFYKQLRYGTNGSEFTVFKFRTMKDEPTNTEFSQATKNDPRITRIGSFLRRSSLDELPQLINVLFGSMSLVGPRPHPTKLNEDYRDTIALYMQRHTVKPGITGLAQVRGHRGETVDDKSMAQRIASDLEYIKNWSFFLDLRILALTVVHVFTTDKAH